MRRSTRIGVVFAVVVAVCGLLQGCDLLDPAAVDAIIRESVRDNTLDHNVWIEAAPYPGQAGWNAAWFAIDGVVYLGAGNASGSGPATKDFWKYDAVADTWSELRDLPGPARDNPVSFAVGGTGYMGGGEDQYASPPASYHDFWKYDPASDTWTQLGDSADAPRNVAVAGDRVFAPRAGGLFEYLVASGMWAERAPWPAPGTAVCRAALSVGSRVYLADDSGVVWQYDPTADAWSQAESATWSLGVWACVTGLPARLRRQLERRDPVALRPDRFDVERHRDSGAPRHRALLRSVLHRGRHVLLDAQ